MGIYNDFAFVYDELTKDVDYNEYFNLTIDIFKKYNKDPKLILELATGTGTFLKKMADFGFDMIGLDISSEMLNIAKEKTKDNNNVLLINQDMTSFELFGTVDVIICYLDAINYITDKRKLKKLFKLVHNYLNNGGLFIFDINSKYKLTNIIGNNTFVYDSEDIFYTWENELVNNKVNFYLTIFKKNKNSYNRIDELHTERIYEKEDIYDAAKDSGMKFKEIFSDFKLGKYSKNGHRQFFVFEK